MAHGSIGLPADGAGKRLHTQTHDVNSEIVHNQVFTLGDPQNSENFQTVDDYGAAMVAFQGGSMEFDSFGNAKVSQVHPLGVYMHSVNTLDEFFTTTTSGTASYTYLPNEKGVKLSVGTASGDKVQRMTDKSHMYVAGITNTVLFSAVAGDTGKEGLVRRLGYYTNEDGLFFEQSGGSFQVVQRSSVSGSIVEERVAQANFNRDKADGTGVSKMILDPTKTNIFWIDFQWLGVGVARFGVYDNNGRRVTLHEFSNANTKNTIYMKSGSLPISYEMFNEAGTASTSEMKIFNAAVYRNVQHYEPRMRFQGSGIQTKTFTSGAFQHVVSMRPSPLTQDGLVNRTILLPREINYSVTEPCLIMTSKDAVFANAGSETWETPLGDLYSLSEMTTDATINYLVESNKGRVIDVQMVDGTGSIDLSKYFGCAQECVTLGADGSQKHKVTIAIKPLNYTAEFSGFIGMNWAEVHL
jgi:hypothetical protein